MATTKASAETAAPAPAAAAAAAKALSLAAVVAEAQEKTKGYLGRIEAAVDDPDAECIAESHLDQELVGHGKRTVGKVSRRVLFLWVSGCVCFV